MLDKFQTSPARNGVCVMNSSQTPYTLSSCQFWNMLDLENHLVRPLDVYRLLPSVILGIACRRKRNPFPMQLDLTFRFPNGAWILHSQVISNLTILQEANLHYTLLFSELCLFYTQQKSPKPISDLEWLPRTCSTCTSIEMRDIGIKKFHNS